MKFQKEILQEKERLNQKVMFCCLPYVSVEKFSWWFMYLCQLLLIAYEEKDL